MTKASPKASKDADEPKTSKAGEVSLFGSNESRSSKASSSFGPVSVGFGTGSQKKPSGTARTSSYSTSSYLLLDSIDEVIACLNCSINEKTSDGATPLLLLCESVQHVSSAKVKNATSLINHGANVNLGVRRLIHHNFIHILLGRKRLDTTPCCAVRWRLEIGSVVA